MLPSGTYVVTGAAGFIGSYLVGYLNRLGCTRLVLVDDFSRSDKAPNLAGKQFSEQVDRNRFFEWCDTHPEPIAGIFHLGARTDTTEMDYEVHRKWNLTYSQQIWQLCGTRGIPLVYASSAATYGNGEWGYADDHDLVEKLAPLNPYGRSKNDFDRWALQQEHTPPFWAGVKFFNVFGPNEYHKGRMASVIFHAFHQLQRDGAIRLFRSHHPDYKDGGQLRDFIYVDDIAALCCWLMDRQPASGLYNGGTGQARTFLDLAQALFSALDRPAAIEFVDTPADIRDKYQYFTEADTRKLRAAGYDRPFTDLETATRAYVQDFLLHGRYF